MGDTQADNELTQKQEAFCLAYVETGIAAEAYRRAYNVRAATEHSSIYANASKLLADTKISLRIKSLQADAAKLSLYTVKAAFDDLTEDRKFARDQQNPSAAVAATKGKMALFGMDKQTVRHTGPDGEPLNETLSPDEQTERVKGIIPQIAPILLSLGWKAPEDTTTDS